MLLKQIRPGRDLKYTSIKKIRQINLNNYDYYGKNKFIYKTTLMEEELHVMRNDLIEIIDIDIDYLSSIDYNEIIKKSDDSLEKLLYLFVCDDNKELDKVYSGDKLMEKVREKLDNYTSALNEVLYYTKADLIDQEVLDEKYNEGIEAGIEQKTIEIVKNMLKLDLDIDIICKSAKLSIEEVEKIKNNVENE